MYEPSTRSGWLTAGSGEQGVDVVELGWQRREVVRNSGHLSPRIDLELRCVVANGDFDELCHGGSPNSV